MHILFNGLTCILVNTATPNCYSNTISASLETLFTLVKKSSTKCLAPSSSVERKKKKMLKITKFVIIILHKIDNLKVNSIIYKESQSLSFFFLINDKVTIRQNFFSI